MLIHTPLDKLTQNVDAKSMHRRKYERTYKRMNRQNARWVGRRESVGRAPPFFASGGPQTGIWSTKMEVKEDTDEMKIVFEPNKR